MKIGNANVKISGIAIAVFGIFTLLLLVTFVLTGERILLVWGIPTVILLLVFPVALNYLSQKQYADLAPVYEAEATTVRIRMINDSMIGKVVRIQGVVEKVRWKFINRPQFTVADRSGEVSVKVFTAPDVDVNEGDLVEVLGMVIMRYMLVGDPIVNGVVIRKIEKKPDPATLPRRKSQRAVKD